MFPHYKIPRYGFIRTFSYKHADESRYPVMPTAVPLLETKIFPAILWGSLPRSSPASGHLLRHFSIICKSYCVSNQHFHLRY
ncbi:uncharacterized protein LAJ45_03885 [Morchella importuna]|uniref:uncharacterized protein n=1 Tax=Morchella importuna TaxID=1174673 RepID=UPI001E8EA5C1|nr:uncharacterized protein LAJ45_03885 [Morchella importuna]KAH8151892.1 hypothetical protein LAJ45_03885 [Morchella importuna]